MNLYIINYRMDGKTRSFELYAQDNQELERMLRAIKHSASYEGEVFYMEDLPEQELEWDLLMNVVGETNE